MKMRNTLRSLVVVGLLVLTGCAEPMVEFEEGDHIVLIGNALADRMQHDGWFESYLQLGQAGKRLVVRNQGFTGDRIDERPRVEGFPTPDEYLAHSEADWVFAMFGYNESYDEDPAGFAGALSRWIDHTREQNYSGEGPPRIVLLSPIAHEDLDDLSLPDGAENNVRLRAYTDAMALVADQKGVPFIDLYGPSLEWYAAHDGPLTLNGVHLNTAGNRVLAEHVVEALLGRLPRTRGRLEAVRAAVLDKNDHWHNRFRTTDGNDVWGTRSTLTFNEQTNYDVLQHELRQLDMMTANRDEVVWAAARGETIQPDDSGVPPAVEVVSNLNPADPQLQGGVPVTGTLDYLSAEESMARMTLENGMEANVFASEVTIPELVNPVQIGVDTRGRLWVATWPTYPKWEPTGEMDDRLLILPDEDRDGVADRAITFAYVHNPTGFEFWNGGVLVASVPDILFLKDTDGDDVADVRIRYVGALGSADTHHSANDFVYGPDGFLYYQRGIFNVSNVETPWESNILNDGTSGMYRFNPRSFEFAFHAPNSPNAHGNDFDYWGYTYATDATGGSAYQVIANEDGSFDMERLLDHTVRPVPSSGILSSDHFPEKNRDNFLILNVIAYLGIKQYTLDRDAETGRVWGTETDDLLVSSDPNFRPTDFEIGDDGGLYVADWANSIIGHMQHNIRDPARDDEHGRIYRITVPGRPLSEHVPIDGQPIPELLEALEHPVNGIRRRARIELSEHPTDEVMAAAGEWMAGFDPDDPADAHHLLEALWLHQQHNVVNTELLDLVLNSPEPHARHAARTVRILWAHSHATRDRMESTGGAAVDDAAASVSVTGEAPDADAIVIRTVPEEMRYDTPRFTVTAGETVKIWFENADYAPHNLVIGEPGSSETIGQAADAMGADGFATGFIPDVDAVLVATGLLNHEGHEVLEFTAPMEPGEYAVICTFPGHRGTMNAIMTVEAR